MKRRLAVLVAGALSAGCGGDATALLVVVDTDLDVPGELAVVRTVVSEATVNDFVLDDESAPRVPFSFAIVPREDDASRTISLRVEARDPDRAPLFEIILRTGFVEGSSRALPVMLHRACMTRTCGADERCIAGGCAARDVDASTLAEVEPGEEI